MSSDASPKAKELDLPEFARRFFKERGAVVETLDQGLNVLLPSSLADVLEVEDHIFLAREPERAVHHEGEALYALQFQTPLMEKIVSLAGGTPPFLQADLRFSYIKSQGFATLIEKQFQFHRCKIKVMGTARIRTGYILITVSYLAQSDEQKQGLMDFSFHLETGALAPGMSGMLSAVHKAYPMGNVRGYAKEEITKLHELVSRYGPEGVEEELVDFVKSMNRRFRRDCLSLDEYYHALEEEMKTGLSRTGISEKRVKEREEKIAMIPDELAAKKKDLLNKYSIKVGFTPVAVLALTTPCVKVMVNLLSGRKKTEISLIYNPVTKSMDPLACPSCGRSSYSMGVCGAMHLVCVDCLERGCSLCS